MYFTNDLNFKKQADDLGIKVWQTPGFLSSIMGVITVLVMIGTYFISVKYDDPRVIIISENIVAIAILIVGSLIVSVVNQVARLNKMKNEFISVASHQLRTPLSAIKWETELLMTKQKRGLNEKQRRTVETISSLSNRMTRLVNDLLDVARIDQKRLVLRKEPTDLAGVIEAIIDMAEPLAKARNVEISFSYNKKKIPKIILDREKMKLAIENLLNNSIKYTTKRGKIEIKLTRQDDDLIFSIKDNGVGIPEEQHGRVFEKFFRSDNVVRYQTEGTGLGLYIVKSIIEQSGGKIWFQSIENVGTVFSFSLPIK